MSVPKARNGPPPDRRYLPERSRDPVGWRLLQEAGARRLLLPGAVLVSRDEPVAPLVLVEDGAVKVVGIAENGHSVVLAIRSAGSIVGEFAITTPGQRVTSVVGLLPSTVITVPAANLAATLLTRPAAAQLLLRSVIARVHEADRRRVEYASYGVSERICRVLLDLAEVFPASAGAGATVIPLVQQDLAGMAGASREATAKVLRRLRQDGAIRTQRSRIVVLRADLIANGRLTRPAPS